MRADSALDIGLLPSALRGKVRAVGNTSLQGALLAISRAEALDQCTRIAASIQPVDLATDPAFQTVFAECMLFPDDLSDDTFQIAGLPGVTSDRPAHVEN